MRIFFGGFCFGLISEYVFSMAMIFKAGRGTWGVSTTSLYLALACGGAAWGLCNLPANHICEWMALSHMVLTKPILQWSIWAINLNLIIFRAIRNNTPAANSSSRPNPILSSMAPIKSSTCLRSSRMNMRVSFLAAITQSCYGHSGILGSRWQWQRQTHPML